MEKLVKIYLMLVIINVLIIMYKIYIFIFKDILLNGQGVKLRKKLGEKNEKINANNDFNYDGDNNDGIF